MTMSNNKELLEEFLGKDYSQWTLDDIDILSRDPEKSILLTTNTARELSELQNNNELVSDVMRSISYEGYVMAMKKAANEALEDFFKNNEDKEELTNTALSMIDQEDSPLINLAGYLVILQTRDLVDINIIDRAEQLRDLFVEIYKKIDTLPTEVSYFSIGSVITVADIVRQSYFEDYEIDPFPENFKEYDSVMKKYNDFSASFLTFDESEEEDGKEE